MADRPLVTVVGATGAQGGAVVRSLLQTGKYNIRGLTRDPTSEKAQTLKRLNDNIELIRCDITKIDDVLRAFQGSWAIFAVTDFWAQPDRPEIELQQGFTMADAAAQLNIPYYIFSMTEDIVDELRDKFNIPHVTQKAKIFEYIKEKYPNLKSIFVELGPYMTNWRTFTKVKKLDDGTIVFGLPINTKTPLHLTDVDDTGPIVGKILEDPDKYFHQVIHICGDIINLEDISKIFTRVTGVQAIAKTLTDEEFRQSVQWLPNCAIEELMDTYKWFEVGESYIQHRNWTNGQKLTKLNTFEDWLKKTEWKGDT